MAEVDLNTIVSIINTVGFPIFVALIMIYIVLKLTHQNNDNMKLLSDTIDNNTLALSNLKAQIDTFMDYVIKHEQV